MRKKKLGDVVSLDDLDPFDLTAKDIPLVEKALAAHEHKAKIWTGILSALRKAAGVPETVTAESQDDKNLAHAPPVIRGPRGPAYPETPVKRLQLHEGSWAHSIYTVLEEANRFLTLHEMREGLATLRHETSFNHPDMQKIHAAVQRLRQQGHVISYKSRLATYDVFKKFKEDLQAGKTEDLSNLPRVHSRWADAVVHYLKDQTGPAKLREITDHIASLPDFEEVKAPLQQVAVTLRGLLRRNVVERVGAGATARWRLRDENAPLTEEIEKERATGELPSVARH